MLNMKKLLTKILDRDVYSTSEKRVGTWIDGKPIYRKVIRTNAGPSTQFTINTGITNYDTVVDVRTFLITGNDYYAYFKPLDLSIRSDGNIYITNNGSAAFNSVLVVIEYTKTTD